MAIAPGVPQAPPLSHRRDDKAVFAAAGALMLFGMGGGWLTVHPSTGDQIAFAVVLLIDVALMAALYERFVPAWERGPHAHRTALVLGIVAVVLCGVFWTGLPFPVGAAALALGLAAESTPAIGLGAFAIVAPVVVLLIG